MQPHGLRNLPIHAENRGDFPLRQQEYLEHQLIPLVRPASHARLAHEDEARNQDRFECEYEIQQWKRKWIEARQSYHG
jgi:hypothetical protein